MSAINDNYLNVQQDILEPLLIAASCENLRNQQSLLAESASRASSSITPASLPSCMRWCASRTSRPAALHHRRNPPRRHRSARLPPRALYARFPPLRPLETPRQGSCCQTPQLSSLSTAAAGILTLPRLPEALRTRLRATHRRPFSAPLKQTTSFNPRGDRNSIASISASSTISTRSSAPSA